MKYFLYKTKTVTLPENLNELNRRQLIGISAIIVEGKPPPEVVMQVLRLLMGYSRWRFVFASTDMLERLIPHVLWVFDKNRLTHNAIEQHKGFYGPKSEFDNLLMREFHLCEIFYRQVVKEDEKDALNNLVAVLYRKPKRWYNKKRDKDGDIRKPLNVNEVGYYAEKVRRWPEGVKWAIFTWYDGCREMLIEMYPEVFGGGAAAAGETEAGLYDVIHGLAGEKFGDFDKVEQLNVHTAMRALEVAVKEAKQKAPK